MPRLSDFCLCCPNFTGGTAVAKTALVVGAGLGGLATALRLHKQGYQVQVVEKHSTAGGRLNVLEKDGFRWDIGPSFFSMSYEFRELFAYLEEPIPFELVELDPLYAVNIAGNPRTYLIYKDLARLAEEFADVEPNMEFKARKYLDSAARIFHDTEHLIIKRNFDGILSYIMSLARVPKKHLPKLFRSFWTELERHFESEEVKIIFSLVAFFLGATPFNTPSIYSLLNYTELEHDGYWNVKGGMYNIVTGILELMEKKGIAIYYNTEIVSHTPNGKGLKYLMDTTGKQWQADLFVINGDAAGFRGQVFQRKKYSEEKLDKMDWTMAPFTMYLGVKGKLDKIHHHNYYLGNNFRGYADAIFRQGVAPEKPYYYVNVHSKSNPECAPEGHEAVFILCPVPDLRLKPDWSDADVLGDEIIKDLSQRSGVDIANNLVSKTVYTPVEWQNMFNLYRGSGLGLAHGMMQIGALRPANKDEEFPNVYYVGASTHPGTGLPIVVIGSKLVTERIVHEHPLV
ncbi:MAG: phytoene desaturase [Bacteroidetes bacterium]|nr:phytoene desaturase [Bacteroidota bacterium]